MNIFKFRDQLIDEYRSYVTEIGRSRSEALRGLAHNHPNCNLTPSEHGKVLTRHVIVWSEEAVRFRRAGLL